MKYVHQDSGKAVEDMTYAEIVAMDEEYTWQAEQENKKNSTHCTGGRTRNQRAARCSGWVPQAFDVECLWGGEKN